MGIDPIRQGELHGRRERGGRMAYAGNPHPKDARRRAHSPPETNRSGRVRGFQCDRSLISLLSERPPCRLPARRWRWVRTAGSSPSPPPGSRMGLDGVPRPANRRSASNAAPPSPRGGPPIVPESASGGFTGTTSGTPPEATSCCGTGTLVGSAVGVVAPASWRSITSSRSHGEARHSNTRTFRPSAGSAIEKKPGVSCGRGRPRRRSRHPLRPERSEGPARPPRCPSGGVYSGVWSS